MGKYVNHDSTLTGEGTSLSPLKVKDPFTPSEYKVKDILEGNGITLTKSSGNYTIAATTPTGAIKWSDLADETVETTTYKSKLKIQWENGITWRNYDWPDTSLSTITFFDGIFMGYAPHPSGTGSFVTFSAFKTTTDKVNSGRRVDALPFGTSSCQCPAWNDFSGTYFQLTSNKITLKPLTEIEELKKEIDSLRNMIQELENTI